MICYIQRNWNFVLYRFINWNVLHGKEEQTLLCLVI